MRCFNRLKDPIKTEEILWQGPFSWPKYGQGPDIPNIPGVYLFTFPYKDGYVLYSAGISKSIKKRIGTHTREYLKGKYNVLDVESAMKGERKEIWHGWGYARMNSKNIMNL